MSRLTLDTDHQVFFYEQDHYYLSNFSAFRLFWRQRHSAHGLRKAGASRAAELGATVPQLMALFDWETSRQAEVYFKAANRARMAADIIGFLDNK